MSPKILTRNGILLLTLVLGCSGFSSAQIGTRNMRRAGFSKLIEDDRLNVTMELCLPSGRANPAFRSYLNGLVNVQPKVQYKVLTNWYVAAGPKYSYYTVSEFKVPKKTNGGAHTYGAFLEAGWQKWQTERFALEIGVKGGVAMTDFVTGLTREAGTPQRVTAMYVEPTLSLILASDEAVAYRWIIGYNISGYDFKPYHIGQVSDGGYKPEDLNKPSQSLLVGFGMSWFFGNQRADPFIEEHATPQDE